MGGVAAADVYQHVYAVEHGRVGLYIVEADELHVEGRAGERLDHAGVGVILLLIQRVVHHVAAPGARAPPGVEHGHGLEAEGGGAADVLI